MPVPATFAPAAEEPPLLLIFHTGDVHGCAREMTDGKKEGQGQLASLGYARMKTFINRQAAGGKMLLDGGDALHGQPLAAAGRGEHIARLLELLEYDALALGGHDFDHGLPRLMELRKRYKLNYIAANIISREDGAALLPPYVVKEFGGLKVGVFGLSSPSTPRLTSPEHLHSVIFGNPEDAVEIAKVMADKLRREAGADLVIALCHLGTAPQSEFSAQDLAREVEGLDLVIDGRGPGNGFSALVGETLVVSAGSRLQNLGQVAVTRDEDGQLLLTPSLIPAPSFAAVTPDAIVDTLAGELEEEAERERSRTAARLPFALNGERGSVRNGSANFGRLACAALQRAARADAAILTSGDFHASLPAGGLSRKNLAAALAERSVVTVRFKGADLMRALNHGLSRVNGSGFPQFYGLRVTARESRAPNADGSVSRRCRAESVEVGNRPLDPSADYTVAISDHMYRGGDGYRMFARYLSQADPARLAEIDRDEVLTIIVEDPAAR
ncbi:MAG: bifunctional metallophosphatase/5'-nucleotidase [Candidatus Adiutrix sp.]|nr:bifunctional metallophosphatase/5'-nucleotidase [Candidatus Adiutrix sp.]